MGGNVWVTYWVQPCDTLLSVSCGSEKRASCILKKNVKTARIFRPGIVTPGVIIPGSPILIKRKWLNEYQLGCRH